MNAKKLAVAAMLSLFAMAIAQAQGPQQVKRDAMLVTATSTATRAVRPPALDGSDADEAWLSAVRITGFRMFDPTEDADAPLTTDARITYDETNLYVFVRAYDPHPDSIIALLSRRDVRTTSDHIKIMIDSYHDRRTGYEFAVNPAGVKRDYYTFDD
jgi:hypothetical protein